jgi:hypothetical protein
MRTQFEDNVFKAIQDYGIVVDKEELIKALQYDRGQYEKGFADGMLAPKQSEWISVEERLPEREGTYLVYTYKGAIKFGDFRCYYAKNDNPQFDYYVTHWMPAPEPPKMKGGAE